MNVQIIVSEEEYNIIKQEAQNHSLAISSYARTKLLDKNKDIDGFYVKLLESFKSNFNDTEEYNGKVIKAFINGLVQRIVI